MHWQMCTVSFLLYRLLPTCLLFVIQLSFGTMSVLTSFTWHMNSPLFYISSNKYRDAATNGNINIVFLKDSPVDCSVAEPDWEAGCDKFVGRAGVPLLTQLWSTSI